MKKQNGISLIVLIVTIIVVIILAAVVILTLTKNNPIESAKEARFKEDVRTFQDELALYISKQYANSGGHWDGNISAKSYNQIVEYIPSFTKKYDGKFVINNNNLEYTNKLDEKEKEYAQSLNLREKIQLLPDEYQQVEYIESSGTQWINTKFLPNQDTRVVLDFQMTDPTKGRRIFGTRYAVTSRAYCFYYQGVDYGYGFYTNYNNNEYYTRELGYNYDRHLVDFDKNNVYIDGALYYSFKYSAFTGYGNAHIFDLNPSINSNIGVLKLYICKIYDDNTIKRDFIPCYSTTVVTDVNEKECPAGTVGLYDTIEGKFYTNQGDPSKGDFIPGPDID